jgi:hypothetical protein
MSIETVNIAHHGGLTSNYGLRGTAVKLVAREFKGVKPDGDGYEDVWQETDTQHLEKEKMRLRGSRKQKAARAFVPRSSVTIVEHREPAAQAVVQARLDGKSADVIKILELEDQIRKMMVDLGQ